MTKKEAILAAATKMFASQGYHETSVSEISAASGVAEGTIFYHFKSKEGLLLHILEEFKTAIVLEFAQYRRNERHDSGLAMVEEAISFYLYIAGHMEDRFLLLQRAYLHRLAESNRTFRGHMEEIYNCLVDIFEQAIVAGQADGSILDIPARKSALIIFTMVDGLVRFKHHNLYDGAALYGELIAASRRMLQNQRYAQRQA